MPTCYWPDAGLRPSRAAADVWRPIRHRPNYSDTIQSTNSFCNFLHEGIWGFGNLGYFRMGEKVWGALAYGVSSMGRGCLCPCL